MTYITRTLETTIQKAVREFPAVVITGPRQSGKTTLLKHLFASDYHYVSLELPDVRQAALDDPRGFLALYPPPVILDEIQYAPDLLPYIKEIIDTKRDLPGQFILTGSQNLLLMAKVSESLAGRAAILKLLPLTLREETGEPERALFWERENPDRTDQKFSYRELWQKFLRGFYPELVANPSRDITLWHASYVQTYLERDVRSLRQIGDLSQFQVFLRALAIRSGQLLNLTELSRTLGLAVNTVKAWISVLEATHQIFILRPYFANIGKRLVKTPKVYLIDVGLLCYLAGLKDIEQAALGPLGGAIFETAVLSEIIKTMWHRGLEPRIYFWRTSSGMEVDFVLEVNSHLLPLEVKLSSTPRLQMASSIKSFRKLLGERVLPGYVVHPGEVKLPLGDGVLALPFWEM